MKGLKKILSIVVLLSSLLAAEGFGEGKFYVGAQLGINTPSVDSQSYDTSSGESKMTLGKSDIIYGVNLGWRYFLDQSFHGVELSVKNTNAEGTYRMGTLGGSYHTNESYEVAYKGGYALAEKTYVTGRLGLGVTKIEHSISGSSLIQNGTFDHSINTLIAGLGVEHYLKENVAVGAEYIYRYGLEDIKYRHEYLLGGGYTDIKGDFTDHSFVVFVNYFF